MTFQCRVNERNVSYVTDRQTDRQTDKYHKTKYFRWWNVIENTCRMGRWSFWSWFDANRSTFDEDMLQHDIYIFVPSDLDLLTVELHHHFPEKYKLLDLPHSNIDWTKGMWQTCRQTRDKLTNITKRGISAAELYCTICVEWAADITARCTLVQSAVLRSHVVCLSVRPSVTLVDCDHIGWSSSKLISPLVSLGCSLLATPTWRVCSKGNIPKFGPKVTQPLLIWASETFDRKLRPNGYR